MNARCYQPTDTGFPNYGARGIIVCDRWRHSFEHFLADMGQCPPGHTLDRRDNDGPYSPENCRWVTRREQMNNTRANHRLTFNGETLNMTAWSARLGIDPRVLESRLRRGWPLERALTSQRHVGHPPNRLITWRGNTHSLLEWAHFRQIPYGTLSARLSRGWTIERALSA